MSLGMRRLAFILLLLVAVVTGPILLQRKSSGAGAGNSDDRLVVITPHTNTIRAEFGAAFARHWKKQTGRTLYIDWRTPGGAADIRKVLDSAYAASAALGKQEAGIDVLFGGGTPEFLLQSSRERLEVLDVFASNPSWFREEVIPKTFTGERYYDEGRTWVGVCLFQLGICYNPGVLEGLGVQPPERWEDLANPAYAGQVAFADPTKSGSVARVLEMIIQEQMQRVLRERGDNPVAREEGWQRSLKLLQKLAANTRYFTDSANRVPYDVAQGDAAAGVCIDYYGRSFEEKLRSSRTGPRFRWVAPKGGGSVSVDPVAVLKGAPHADIAQEFVRFCLSDEGQLLWNLRPGEPGGPQHVALRRLPVRRDLYTPENLQRFSDHDAMPFEGAADFVYREELTRGALPAITATFRAMCMDPHEELRAAWLAMNRGGGGDADRAALVAFSDVSSLSYEHLMNEIVPLFTKKDTVAAGREMTRLSEIFRANYQRASNLAEQP
ncbi:extracellular solute-binding protein [Haloferula sp. BvORR071]|uniref:ABC transporter substrate-binding protein n=1 Tax=Haloferula sp. BvORR071 TaxID=1396141 RepID=UPI00069815EF|nr:extracellular solute-binding protein [Haloferula sp. BvORR071]